MDPELGNNNVDIPEVLWNNQTVFTEGYNDSSFNQTSDIDGLEYIVLNVFFILIGLCGMVGNGIVIWLLGFCLKRNLYGVYILNLAIADFTYLSTVIANYTDLWIFFPIYLLLFINSLEVSSYLVGLSLLMVISIERCVSVLWPIWYKCHRPAHLSTIVSTVVWILFIIIFYLITFVVKPGYSMWSISILMSLPTILVLFVSSLTLFIRVQCYSQQRKPSRLYWTILINVLVFLLLSVPRGVYLVGNFPMYSRTQMIRVVYITTLLCAVNSTVNPIIYFFVGRHGQQQVRKPLREVLQRALTDNAEAAERREPSPHIG